MYIWKLWSETGTTQFHFPMDTDREFLDSTAPLFDQHESLKNVWQKPMMRSGSPRIHPSAFEIPNTDVWVISQHMVKKLQDNASVENLEFLPVETNHGLYFAIHIILPTKCLNKENSRCTAIKDGPIVHFSLLDFDRKKIPDDLAIFRIPELPYLTFITDRVQKICLEHDFKGLSFAPKHNLIWDEYNT